MLLIVPALIPLAALVIGLDYLRRTLLPDAPSTEAVGEPYTPPFEGGQCDAAYTYTVFAIRISNGLPESFGNRSTSGAISSIEPFNNNPVLGSGIRVTSGGATATVNANAGFYRDFYISNIVRSDGQPDGCGNLPNPNEPPSPSSDGLANSAPPDLADDDLVIEGSPIVPYNPLSAALAALLAALKAASDLKDAIDFIGDMLDKIGKGIDEVKDWLDDKNKDPSSGKDIKRHDYGSIRKDGFLRLFPNGEANGFTPEYLDLQLLSIPIGYGKYFGNLSPHFYRFKSLGYISFVSPSFGNLQTVEIEFSRCSINVPPNAYGFFYHLGLENAIRANVSLFYSIDKPVEG